MTNTIKTMDGEETEFTEGWEPITRRAEWLAAQSSDIELLNALVSIHNIFTMEHHGLTTPDIIRTLEYFKQTLEARLE